MKKHWIVLVSLLAIAAGWYFYRPPQSRNITVARKTRPQSEANGNPVVPTDASNGKTAASATPAASVPVDPKEDPNREPEECNGYGRVDLADGTASIRGNVLSAEGRGVYEAVITLLNHDKEIEEPIFTDEKGGFEFVRVPAGEYIVLCEYAPEDGIYVSDSAVATVTDGQNARVEIKLEPEGTAVLSGTVRSEKGPLSGVRVELQSDRSSFQATATTEGDGAFLLSRVPAGPARVRVIQEGGGESVLYDASVEIGTQPHLNITVRMERRATLSVRVLTQANEPVTESRVCAMKVERAERSVHSKIAAWGYTDEKGEIRFENLEMGEYSVQGEGTGSLRVPLQSPAMTAELRVAKEEPESEVSDVPSAESEK